MLVKGAEFGKQLLFKSRNEDHKKEFELHEPLRVRGRRSEAARGHEE